ncbi:hypothetical protein C4D60_Mb05t11020 [Musa balbisiana]|uniref:Uncharacterized protein n=1 Tax=Musa balbisiana TaxID=52838 RepID=A0A4S8JVA5_MUSBA|nr:hypothetical protein C4D60_Mb05t11020 [Musa balbisiana]
MGCSDVIFSIEAVRAVGSASSTGTSSAVVGSKSSGTSRKATAVSASGRRGTRVAWERRKRTEKTTERRTAILTEAMDSGYTWKVV